jgi:hypothetical protein
VDGQVDETVAAELRKEKRSRSDKDEVSIHLWVNRVQTEITTIGRSELLLRRFRALSLKDLANQKPIIPDLDHWQHVSIYRNAFWLSIFITPSTIKPSYLRY